MTEIREPRVFSSDDPKIIREPDPLPGDEPDTPEPHAPRPSNGASLGGVFLTALSGLVTLAIAASFWNFVANALERNDWIGWTATSLAGIAALTGLLIAVRELVGLVRLGKLTQLRRDAELALRTQDRTLERKTVKALAAGFQGRRDLSWNVAQLNTHTRDVRDPGELMRLAERELLVPLDAAARRLILKSAKRVLVVTAMSPMVWMAMLFVMVENVRMLKGLAALYGGRPGGLGALKLARLVVGHIVATGGLAMTDDLVGQFLGQDLMRRLSRRLGEGAFNGALTARIGTAAIDVTRPIPFLDTDPIRVRDLLPELLRRTPKV
jgi:putative membrane protein